MRLDVQASNIVSAPIKDGVTINKGQPVAISGGEAILADSNSVEAEGLAKLVYDGKVFIQTGGKYPLSGSEEQFWLGPNGSIVENNPDHLVDQRIAKRLDSEYILITPHREVIL